MNIPIPNMIPPANITQRGPYLSFSRPPMIIVMKLTALAVENTDARFAFSSSAIGADKLLHAYIDPMHRLMRQAAIRITQRCLVRSLICLFVNSIFTAPFIEYNFISHIVSQAAGIVNNQCIFIISTSLSPIQVTSLTGFLVFS